MSQKYRDRIMRSSGISQKKVESEYGERIMKMMGYSGGGLGATGEGRLEPVQVGRIDDNEGIGFKLNKNEVEDGWWKKSYTKALEEVKNNYVASEEESEEEKSDSSSSEGDENSNEESSSEYDEEDEVAFQHISKKYLKKA